MLDCPEQTQTSPTRMLFTVTVLSPVNVSVKGPPARIGFRSTRQTPFSAIVVTF